MLYVAPSVRVFPTFIPLLGPLANGISSRIRIAQMQLESFTFDKKKDQRGQNLN